jgi:hypothetical protein
MLQFEGVGFANGSSGGGTLKKELYTFQSSTITLDVSADFTQIVDVLRNGQEIYLTRDFTVSSGIITFVKALDTTDVICVKGK